MKKKNWINLSQKALPIFMAASLTISAALAGQPVLLISIDGLKPAYVLEADKWRIGIPNLRTILAKGTHAEAVQGVLPANTFPGHTAVITGTAPARNGIYHNRPFESPFDKKAYIKDSPWSWEYKNIMVPTLWGVAHKGKQITANVGWPVTLGSTDINYNIPERIVGTNRKGAWDAATLGLYKEIGEAAEKRIKSQAVKFAPDDWQRTCYAIEIIQQKKPDLLTVHLAKLDSMQHAYGTFTGPAFNALEEIDVRVGELVSEFRKVHPDSVIAISSDHGHVSIHHTFRIFAAFERAGLITFTASRKNSFKNSELKDWVAMPKPVGGSCPIFLKDPSNSVARAKVKKVLDELAANPLNGIASVLERQDIEALGGFPGPDFWVDLVPGFSISYHLNNDLAVPTTDVASKHGYSPTHPEMYSSFFIMGSGIKQGGNLGKIDMRSIAPTLAKVLGVPMPSAEGPVLEVFQ